MKHAHLCSVLGAAVVLLAAGGCTMKNQDPPPVSGPSEFGTSLVIAVSPDVLTQDGASQSVVTVTARDGNGQPVRNLALRNEIFVNGAVADFGMLSARNLVTGSDGRTTFVYTAPPSAGSTAEQVINIGVTPIGTDFNNAVTRMAALRLVPQGYIPPPAGLQPAFTFSPEAPLEGQTVFFDGTASTSSILSPITSYTWDFGDGRTASGATTTHVYGAPGDYFARLTVGDALGRTASTTQRITITQSVAPSASFVFSPTDPRTGQPMTFNGSASLASSGRRIVSYSWDFGDGSQVATSSSPIASHTYTQARTYTITLVVTDDLGRTGAFSTTVTVAVP
jgi:PKD repeat protein